VADEPGEPAITRLVGALLLEQNEAWQLRRRVVRVLNAARFFNTSRITSIVRAEVIVDALPLCKFGAESYFDTTL
jgi:hypothetical protein